MRNHFAGKLALQQRVLPTYRAPFFDLLADSCTGGLSLFAGLPRAEESIAVANELENAKYRQGKNFHLFKRAFYFCYQEGLINWLEAWNPDALIVEANPRYLSTPSAIKWMHARDKKVIGWGLGAPVTNKFLKSYWASFVRHFDGMIAYSQRGAEEYAALGFPRQKIFVAHNSVSPAPNERYERAPRSTDRATVLFVGRLQARKRVDYLLQVCAEMEPKPRLIIIGDGPERGKLEQLARQVYPSAEFIGAKHDAELKPYFEQADLFALPGTGGLAVQQAMSYGLPVIVAKGDGTQDDLVREGNGWQIPPDDYDALVSTMKSALSDAARLRKMGAESYRIVKEEINLEKMVEVFVTALNLVTRP